MKSGTVKWFNNSKGYGFIRPDEGGEDLFVHYSYIEMEGYKTLKAGQAVNYQVTQADKGLHATHIVTLDTAPLDETGEANQSSAPETERQYTSEASKATDGDSDSDADPDAH